MVDGCTNRVYAGWKMAVSDWLLAKCKTFLPQYLKVGFAQTQRTQEDREETTVQQMDCGFFCWVWPDKQAITGNNCGDYYGDLPALQVEQVKRGCFEAIYEDNVWKVKPNSNDQNWKSVLEFLFLSIAREIFNGANQGLWSEKTRPYQSQFSDVIHISVAEAIKHNWSFHDKNG